jgi:hypothetical protein
MKSNTGKTYEEMVLRVYQILCGAASFADVRHNVKLQGPDGERQIDVLVIHDHANVRYLTVIECKDFRGKVNVTYVDAFASKLLDVKANKGILVSRREFTKTAVQKAKRLGIELCMIDFAEQLLKDQIREIPVVLSVIHGIQLAVQVFFGNKSERDIPIDPKAFTIINDKPLRELLIQDLRDGQTQIPTESCEIPWTPAKLVEPYFIRDKNQNKLDVEWFRVMVKIDINFYVGKANEFPDFVTHLQYGDQQIRVVVPREFRLGFGKELARFKRKSDIPVHAKEAFPCIVLPESENSELKEPKLYLYSDGDSPTRPCT